MMAVGASVVGSIGSPGVASTVGVSGNSEVGSPVGAIGGSASTGCVLE